MSGISWTDQTWNPIVGCTKVSSGCQNCWAERMAKLHYHGDFPNGWDGHVKLFPERLEQPLHWRKPRRIAVGLMGDLFHDSVPDEFIENVFWQIGLAKQITFQVLTKRPERMQRFLSAFYRYAADQAIVAQTRSDWYGVRYENPPVMPFENLWIGVSVEDQKTADERIPLLLQTPAAVRFVSLEPLLGPVDLRNIAPHDDFWTDSVDTPDPSRKLSWVICGGESGPGARPMHPDWVRSLRDQCVSAGVAFHFKQFGEWVPHGQGVRSERRTWGVIMPDGIFNSCHEIGHEIGHGGACVHLVGKKSAGHLLDGKEWMQFPESTQ